MVLKSIIVSIAATTLAGAAFADAENRTDRPGEALAWTLAAYVSCDEAANLPEEIKAEVTAFGADGEETLKAMRLLADEDGACGPLRLYAIDMVSLASQDMTAFEELLEFQAKQEARISNQEKPEGPAAVTTSLVADTVANVPLSSGTTPTSDYQN